VVRGNTHEAQRLNLSFMVDLYVTGSVWNPELKPQGRCRRETPKGLAAARS